MKILSIVICSLPSRIQKLHELISILNPQLEAAGGLVGFYVLMDNKQMTTGEKRNWLLRIAKSKYVVFIDDDDWVPDYYISEMLKACGSDADCIAINGWMTTDGDRKICWRLSKDNENKTIHENGEPVYLRKTNHITAVKLEYALMAGFPEKSNAEDKAYSEALNQFLKTEVKIDLDMYHYKYSSHNKEYS
jgi:hypothetical protein